MGFRAQHRAASRLGRSIRLIRKRLNLSQAEFGMKVGWPADSVAKYEMGYFRPGPGRLVGLLRLAEGAERLSITRALRRHGILGSDFSPLLFGATATVAVHDNQMEPADPGAAPEAVREVNP